MAENPKSEGQGQHSPVAHAPWLVRTHGGRRSRPARMAPCPPTIPLSHSPVPQLAWWGGVTRDALVTAAPGPDSSKGASGSPVQRGEPGPRGAAGRGRVLSHLSAPYVGWWG